MSDSADHAIEEGLKRRNRHISLTMGTAIAVVVFILALFAGTLAYAVHLSDEFDRAQNRNTCRSELAEDERKATLDLLVATGQLFVALGGPSPDRAALLANYDKAVMRAQVVNARDISVECG